MSDNPTQRDDPALLEALVASYSILSLLHHRGLIDSPLNREDVATALAKLRPFALAAEQRMMNSEAGVYLAGTARVDRDIERAYADGMSEVEIARQLGVNRLTVRKWLGK